MRRMIGAMMVALVTATGPAMSAEHPLPGLVGSLTHPGGDRAASPRWWRRGC